MRHLALILALLAAAPALAAEEPGIAAPDPKVPQGANLDVPQGWRVRTDDPLASAKPGKEPTADIYFVNMTPGWHLTTGPAAIFHHPGLTAKGDYRLTAKIHFFDPKGGHLEGWGLFFGGSDLEGEKQSYGYFLLRNDRKFLIKKRHGATTELVRDWSPSDAIVAFDGSAGQTSATNVLTVEARASEVAFAINGKEVAVVPRAELPAEGAFGLRVNHHVNLHVSELSATPLGGD